jgi:hypothetical protein
MPCLRLKLWITATRFVSCSAALLTLTGKLRVAVLPAASLTVQVTVVVPIAKVVPLGGLQPPGDGPLRVSVAAVA